MVKDTGDTGYELPVVFSAEDVFRVFGYRTADELDRFLSDCPRHYIRSYFAEIYMGSADKAQGIRSNNDKYLYKKIVQAIQSAGIPVKHGKGGKGGKQGKPQVVKAAAGHRTTATRSDRQQSSRRAASAQLSRSRGRVEQETPRPHSQPPLTSALAQHQLPSGLLSKEVPAELRTQLLPSDLPQALAMQSNAQHQLIYQLGAKLLASLAASRSAFQNPICSLQPRDAFSSQVAADSGISKLITDPACLLQTLCSSCLEDTAMLSQGLEQLQTDSDSAGREAQSTAVVAEQLTDMRDEAPIDSASRSTMGLRVQQWSPEPVSDRRRPLPAAAHEASPDTITPAQTSPSGDSGAHTVCMALEHGSIRGLRADASPVSQSACSKVPAARSVEGMRKQATTSSMAAAKRQHATWRGFKRRRRELSPPRKCCVYPSEEDALSAGSHEPETPSSFLALLNAAHIAQEQETMAAERCVQA